MQKFQDHGQVLSVNFVRDFPMKVHQEILRRENEFFNELKGQCQDYVKVTFGPQVSDSKESIESLFQAGLVKIEAAKCYDNADPKDLIEISADAGFKRRAFSTLKNITTEENLDCEWTYAPTIGKSHYCYLNFDLENNKDVRSQVNFLTFNNSDPAFEAPVYFREALVTARRMGPQTLYYVQSYVRATPLSNLKQIFAEKYILQSQSQVFQELERRLRQKRTSL
jgi:hypothetical protein